MKPSNESSINKNQLLGIDRFKMCIPSNFLKKGYTKYFNMKQIYIKNRNKEKNIYSKIYYLNSSLPKHICIFLSITFSNSRGGNSFMLSKNLCIDINVPKYIYGNNIYESTFSDLMNTIQQIIPILTDFVNIYDLYANTEIYYLESGVGIYFPSSHNLITFCYQNTRSYNKNKIKLEPYVNGGLGCYISNKHKKLSYYDKNLEIKHSSPDNPILTFLTKNNIEITRMEVKYSTKQEVRKLAKKYLNKDFISLYDLLFTNITPLILQEEWLKQKDHMNIYNLSTTDVNKIFTHIVNSKLSKKMKEGLIYLIDRLTINIPFNTIYNQLQKSYSKNFPHKIICEFNKLISCFNIPVYKYISYIESNIKRTKPIQYYFTQFNNTRDNIANTI